MIPGAFYTFVTTAYLLNAKIGFGLSWTVAYIIAAILCVAYVAVILWYGNKRKNK